MGHEFKIQSISFFLLLGLISLSASADQTNSEIKIESRTTLSCMKSGLNSNLGVDENPGLSEGANPLKLLNINTQAVREKLEDRAAKKNLEKFLGRNSNYREAYNKLPLNERQAVQRENTVRENWIKSVRIGKKLEELGVEAELQQSENYYFFTIKGIKHAKESKLNPSEKVLRSKEFDNYLKLADQEGGAIILDPSMTSMGYFQNLSDIIPGKLWFIAVKPDTNWGTLIHEWQHKIDLIDDGEKKLGYIHEKLGISPSQGGVKGWAAETEKRFSTELSATARQYKLYWETKKLPLVDSLNVVLYRGLNQSKVAVARIIMSPSDPKHYVLLIRGGVKVLLPILAPTVGIMGALNLAKYLVPIEKDQPK